MTRPVIAYDNKLENFDSATAGGGLTAEIPLAVNWLTYDFLEFGPGETVPVLEASLRMDFDDEQGPVSILAIIVDQSIVGLDMRVRFSFDGSWADWINIDPFVQSGPALREIPEQTGWDRVEFEWTRNNLGDRIRIPMILLGPQMHLERSAFLNVTPPGFNPSDEYNRNRSESGQTMGLTLKRLGIQNEISFDNVSLEWIKDEWKPFADHMRKKACFWAWDQDDNPLDVAFVERDGNPQANPTTIGGPNQQGYWQVSLPVKGIAE